ncbi:MAG: hypothetical protein OXB86_05090 [Bdellovibrionales bacterium]|nr:hypothetical protein [Bdellovibrionales bacterium]
MKKGQKYREARLSIIWILHFKNSALRFALVRLTAASVLKPNSFLNPIGSHEGLIFINRNSQISNLIGIKFKDILFINFFSMSNFDYKNSNSVFFDRIYNTVVSYPYFH